MSARAWRGRKTGQWSTELKAAKRARRAARRDDRDDIERMFGPPLPGDEDFEPFDPAKNREALAALAKAREEQAGKESGQ